SNTLAMSLHISTAMPDHSPEARSLLKYGSSPGRAAARTTLVRWMRSKVDSPPGAWAMAAGAAISDVAGSAAPASAAAAKSRRDSMPPSFGRLFVVGDADAAHRVLVHRDAEAGPGRHRGQALGDVDRRLEDLDAHHVGRGVELGAQRDVGRRGQ